MTNGESRRNLETWEQPDSVWVPFRDCSTHRTRLARVYAHVDILKSQKANVVGSEEKR